MDEMDEMEDYSVALVKGAFGLGIYFAAGPDGRAAVDAGVPFYRLPGGELAPGEASGVIAPGDALVRINDVDTEQLALAEVVEELRAVLPGDVTLTFRRCRVEKSENENQHALDGEDGQGDNQEDEDEEEPMTEEQVGAATSTPSTPSSKSWGMLQRLSFSSSGGKTGQALGRDGGMEIERVNDLQVALERERKCRFLAEKKNILYRNELLRVSQENSALRDQLARATDDLRRLEIFAQRNLHLAI